MKVSGEKQKGVKLNVLIDSVIYLADTDLNKLKRNIEIS
jgi:hypothetical protein